MLAISALADVQVGTLRHDGAFGNVHYNFNLNITQACGNRFSGDFSIGPQIIGGVLSGSRDISYIEQSSDGYIVAFTGNSGFSFIGNWAHSDPSLYGVSVYIGDPGVTSWVGMYDFYSVSTFHPEWNQGRLEITSAANGVFSGRVKSWMGVPQNLLVSGSYMPDGSMTMSINDWSIITTGRYGNGWAGTWTDGTTDGVFLDTPVN